VVEPTQNSRNDLNRLTIWKVSSTGELLETFNSTENLPGLINAISVTSSGLSIVGQYNQRSFIQSVSPSGTFGKVLYIGTSKTTLNSVVRNSDGSTSAFGSSTETLGGKKLAAKQDGLLIKISKSGSLTNVVRSSAISAERSWLSADSNFLLSGYVKVGKKIETAITKFSPTFAPVWTLRVPSTGESRAITAGKSSVVALSSNASVPSLIGWNPTKAGLLLLTFDGKGLITAAKGSSELITPIALSYSKEVGAVGLAKSSDGSVALFKF
jgi:WD40 repeat protein